MAQHVTISYDDLVPVSKDDNTDDPAGPFAGIYTGEGGDIKVTTLRGTTVVWKSTAAGTIMPIPVKRVWSTGTAATTPLGAIEGGIHGKRVSS